MWNEFKNLCIAFYLLGKRIILSIVGIFVGIYKFLLPLQNSIRGVVNPEEFYRILLLSISTGGTFQGFIDYMKNHVQDFITDPILLLGVQTFCKHCQDKQLPVVFFIVLFTGDYLRRKFQGSSQ